MRGGRLTVSPVFFLFFPLPVLAPLSLQFITRWTQPDTIGSVARRQAPLDQQIHRPADRQPHNPRGPVHPAIARQFMFFTRPKYFEVLRWRNLPPRNRDR